MRTRGIRTAFIFSTFLVAPAALSAQEQDAAAPPQLPPEAQEMIAELQQVQATLQPIQEQALQHPEIQAAQQELGAEIRAAMAEVDPSTPERMAHFEELIERGQAAQAAQDDAALTEIAAEAQEVQAELRAAEAAAIQRPEIAPRLEAFQAKLLERMIEVDPQAESLLERARELDAALSALLGQGG